MNPETKESRAVIFGLVSFLGWLFILLPMIYSSGEVHLSGELLGIKYGEWLLSGITLLLAWTTWRLVKGGETASRQQLRAYIFIEGCEVSLFRDSRIIANVRLKNFGLSPGYDFRTWTNVRIGLPDEEPFGEKLDWKQSSIIAPSANLNAPSPIVAITQEQLQDIFLERSKIYVWGEAEYKDAFGLKWKFTFRDSAGGQPSVSYASGDLTGQWGLSPKGYDEISL